MSEDSGEAVTISPNANLPSSIDVDNMERQKKNLKDNFTSKDIENIKTKVSKTTQVDLKTWVSVNDLSSDAPSVIYWQMVAEKRRAALSEALAENKKLHDTIEYLTRENTRYQELLEESNSFVEVCKDLMNDSANDTGIDVADLDPHNRSMENTNSL